MVNVSIDELASEITLAVKEYTENVTEAIGQELDERSKQMVQDIKASPEWKDGSGDKKYRKGWTRKKTSTGGLVEFVVYNKTKPGLAHLLENGHVKRGGGRVASRPHIRPAYDRNIPELERRIKAIIQNGG